MCAFELDSLFADKIAGLYNANIQLKIGLATGMPVVANKTFFEETIKLADRLCFIDKSNIVISSEVQNSFITENLNAPFDREWHNPELKVEDFDLPLGMSKTQVYRKVMLLTGKSPNNFVREYRLTRALERINQNTDSISEIAFETGFNSQSYFSKCFQRRFELLPSDYIRS